MRLRVGVLVLSLSLAAALPAGAQNPSSSDSTRVTADVAPAASQAPVAQAPTAGAPLAGLRAGVHAREARPDQPFVAPSAQRANLGEARAMMIVGVAGLIAGAIIGDTPGTIIMVGGAVIGLVGLYDYLK